MKSLVMFLLVLLFAAPCYGQISFGSRSRQPSADLRANRFDPNSLSNPYGAGSRYKTDGLMNPYSQYGSRYSNDSWRNPYATNPPKLYSDGKYLGELSTNRYSPDSTSNPYGQYGSRYSPDSINNPFGAGLSLFNAADLGVPIEVTKNRYEEETTDYRRAFVEGPAMYWM